MPPLKKKAMAMHMGPAATITDRLRPEKQRDDFLAAVLNMFNARTCPAGHFPGLIAKE